MTGSNIPSPVASPFQSPVASRRSSIADEPISMGVVSRSNKSSRKSSLHQEHFGGKWDNQPEYLTFEEQEFRRHMEFSGPELIRALNNSSSNDGGNKKSPSGTSTPENEDVKSTKRRERAIFMKHE